MLILDSTHQPKLKTEQKHSMSINKVAIERIEMRAAAVAADLDDGDDDNPWRSRCYPTLLLLSLALRRASPLPLDRARPSRHHNDKISGGKEEEETSLILSIDSIMLYNVATLATLCRPRGRTLSRRSPVESRTKPEEWIEEGEGVDG